MKGVIVERWSAMVDHRDWVQWHCVVAGFSIQLNVECHQSNINLKY
jgi:hypothetical protein